jgi:putative membrane protein
MLGWMIRIAFFALVLWFALKNTTPVPLRLTESLRWDGVPLILIMLGCLVIGALAAAAALAPALLRNRRQAPAQAPAPESARVIAAAERSADELANAARNAGAGGQVEDDAAYAHRRR